MKLHFRGIKVPALGSPRDIVYRNYLSHEAKVEAKKHQLFLLITMASADFVDDSSKRTWDKQAKTVFEEYVMFLYGQQEIPEDKEETKLQQFYAEVIKDSKPVLSKDKDGKLVVTNLPNLFNPAPEKAGKVKNKSP
jgi:hypothetical protein